MKCSIDVNLDMVLTEGSAPAILGPDKGSDSTGWVIYFPGKTPCICNSFQRAAILMRKWLAER